MAIPKVRQKDQFDPWLTPEAKIYIQQRLLLITQDSAGLYKFALDYCPGILWQKSIDKKKPSEDKSRRAIQLFADKWKRKHPDRPITSAFEFMSALNCRYREKKEEKPWFTRWRTRIGRAITGRPSEPFGPRGPRDWLDKEAIAWLADELNFVYPIILVRMMIDSPKSSQAIYNQDMDEMGRLIDAYERGANASIITSKELLLRMIVTKLATKLNVRDYPYNIPHLLVECLVNGTKTKAVIDTGGMDSIITAKMAYACNLPEYQLDQDDPRINTFTGIGSYDMIGKFRNVSFQVGSFITVIDLYVAERGPGYLVLGMSFLRKHKCQVSVRLDAVVFPKLEEDPQVDHPCRHRAVVHQIAGSDRKQAASKEAPKAESQVRKRSSSDYGGFTRTSDSEQSQALPKPWGNKTLGKGRRRRI